MAGELSQVVRYFTADAHTLLIISSPCPCKREV